MSYRCQGDAKQTGNRRVVKTRDHHLVRNGDCQHVEILHHHGCGAIVVTDNGIGIVQLETPAQKIEIFQVTNANLVVRKINVRFLKR